jgi:hypothetical protein
VLAGLEPMRDGMRPGMSIDAAMSQALESKIFKTAKGGATTAPATTQPAGTQPAAAPPPAGQSADAAAGQAR